MSQTNNPAAPKQIEIDPVVEECIRNPHGKPLVPTPAETPQPPEVNESWANDLVETVRTYTEAHAPDPRDSNLVAATASVGTPPRCTKSAGCLLNQHIGDCEFPRGSSSVREPQEDFTPIKINPEALPKPGAASRLSSEASGGQALSNPRLSEKTIEVLAQKIHKADAMLSAWETIPVEDIKTILREAQSETASPNDETKIIQKAMTDTCGDALNDYEIKAIAEIINERLRAARASTGTRKEK